MISDDRVKEMEEATDKGNVCPADEYWLEIACYLLEERKQLVAVAEAVDDCLNSADLDQSVSSLTYWDNKLAKALKAWKSEDVK